MQQAARARRAVLAVVIGSAALSGCAHGRAKSETTQRVAETSGELSTRESLRTAVESVDRNSRSVTLRDADGRPFTIVAGDPEALERLHPNDPVRLVYQEAVAFQLQAPPKREGDQGAQPVTVHHYESRPSPQGEGIEFRRRVDTVVEILDVAPEGKAATFRIPEGNVRAVAIEDVENRQKVKGLRPGDAVAVVYTEKLLLERDR